MEIKLTRDFDVDPDRIIRLAKVLICILEKLPFRKEDMIKELNDHKGSLTIYWNKEPTVEQKNIVSNAWEEVGELKQNVEHVVS